MQSRFKHASFFLEKAQYDKIKCIFIDIFRFNLNLCKSRLDLKSANKPISNTAVSGSYVSFIIASNQTKVIYYEIIKYSSVNIKIFKGFLSHLLEKWRKKVFNDNYWLIVDNLGINMYR